MSRELTVMAIRANLSLERSGNEARLKYSGDGSTLQIVKDSNGVQGPMSSAESGYGEAVKALTRVLNHQWYPPGH